MSENGSADAGAEPKNSDEERAHLDGVDDGCGCAEVWEQLSERRDEGVGAKAEAESD